MTNNKYLYEAVVACVGTVCEVVVENRKIDKVKKELTQKLR